MSGALEAMLVVVATCFIHYQWGNVVCGSNTFSTFFPDFSLAFFNYRIVHCNINGCNYAPCMPSALAHL